ncbi:MAG: NUDIX domain-containing protein [Candidatus Nanoarchaeia archaeon]
MKSTHVVVFFIDEHNKQIYLVRKEVAHKPHLSHLHLKLNGFGGEVEEYDNNEYAAAKREIWEELNIDLNEFKVIKQGTFITSKGVVGVFKAKCNDSNSSKLQVGYIKNEGEASWYDFDYIINNEEELPKGYIKLYEKLFQRSIDFELDFRD